MSIAVASPGIAGGPCGVTVLLSVAVPGGELGGVALLGAAGSVAVLEAPSAPAGRALVRSEGTPESTAAIASLPDGSSVRETLPEGGRLVLRLGTSASSASLLWRTDGTAPGTVEAGSVASGAAGFPSLVSGRRRVLVSLAGPETEIWGLSAKHETGASRVSTVPLVSSAESAALYPVDRGALLFGIDQTSYVWFVAERRGKPRLVLRGDWIANPLTRRDWVAPAERGVFFATVDADGSRWSLWLAKGRSRAKRVASHPASNLRDAEGRYGGIEQLIAVGRRVFYTAAGDDGVWTLWTTTGGRVRRVVSTAQPSTCDTGVHGSFCRNPGIDPRLVVDERLYLLHDGMQVRTTATGSATEPSALPLLPTVLDREPLRVGEHALFWRTTPGQPAEVVQTDGTPTGTAVVTTTNAGPGAAAVASDRLFLLDDDAILGSTLQAVVLSCP